MSSRRAERVRRLSKRMRRDPIPWRLVGNAIWAATVTTSWCLCGVLLGSDGFFHTDFTFSEAPAVSVSWTAAPYPSCQGSPPLLAPGESLCVIYELRNLSSTTLRLSGINLVLDPDTLPRGCPASSLDLSEAGVNGSVTVPAHKEVIGPTGRVTMKAETPEACMDTRFNLTVSERITSAGEKPATLRKLR